MIEKRNSPVHLKVIKPTDIVHLANLFNSIYEELLNKHKEDIKNKAISEYAPKPRINFMLKCDDNIEYSSDNLELFKQDSIVYNRVFIELQFHISYFELNYEVRMSLSSDRYSHSYFEVEGSNSNFVVSTFQKLRDFVDRLEQQESKIKRYRWLIAVILTIMIGWFIGSIVYFILNYFIYGLDPSVYYFCTFGFIFILSGFALPITFAGYFSELWPDIEIVPGPEHRRVLQIRRGRLNWIFSVIIVPFLLSIIVALIIRS